MTTKLSSCSRWSHFGQNHWNRSQIYAPHWNSQFCADQEQARVTRRRLLEHCAGERALLLPTHFGAPHVVAVDDAGGGLAARFISPSTRPENR